MILRKAKLFIIKLYLCLSFSSGFSQDADSLMQERSSAADTASFTANLGITNNGFSIVPAFSLNSPALLAQIAWRKKRFGFEPDIRLTPNGRKGAMLFWFRYYAIQKKKFSWRMGIHPSFLLQTREIMDKGVPIEISQTRRFIAWEMAPNFQPNKYWGMGVYYLQGNALQKDGPQTTHFVNLYTSFSNLNIGGEFRLKLVPAVFYLNLDGYSGTYFTGTVNVSHTKLPFAIQSMFNQTFSSDLPGNVDFLWNVSLHYNFSRKSVKVK